MLDLSQYKFDESLPFNLIDPKTGSQLDAKIWIHSFHSKKATDVVLECQRNRKEGEPALTNNDLLPHLVTKWEKIGDSGKALKCTLETVKEVLEKHDWILKQAYMAASTGEYSPKH